MPIDEVTKLDYEEVNRNIRWLQDVRFKLLAIVPVTSAAAIGFLGSQRTSSTGTQSHTWTSVVVGLLGLVATSGLAVYDRRNSWLHDALISRAKVLEERLGMECVFRSAAPFSLGGCSSPSTRFSADSRSRVGSTSHRPWPLSWPAVGAAA